MGREKCTLSSGILQAFVSSFCTVLLLSPWSDSDALEYRDATWGFDGLVVPDSYNLLSVTAYNPGPERFDGVVSLEQSVGFGKIGGTLVRPCYLEAGDTRLLQFYPRITGNNKWRLSDGTDKLDLDPPKEGAPAIVRLFDGEDPLQLTSEIKLFPHQRFPTTVGGTDGVLTIVIDYIPEFAPSQRTAFVDWLHAGGRLHIFLNRDGIFPELELAAIAPESVSLPAAGQVHTQIIGNGVVTWHGEILDKLAPNEAASLAESKPKIDPDSYYMPIDMPLFQSLQSLTSLKVAWPLVYLAAFAYIGLLGPGHYFWVRGKKRDYRLVLTVLFGTVIVFGALFALIGRRGYGEQTQVSTVSLARHIDGSRYDVTSWGNLFVTSGDDYEIKHPSTHNLYSTGEAYESINATISNGREGAMRTEVPVFSSRTFVHRGTLEGMQPPEFLGSSSPEKRSVRTLEWKLPDGIEVENAWVREGAHTFEADVISRTGRVTLIHRSIYSAAEDYYPGNPSPDDILNFGKVLLHRLLGLQEPYKPKYVPWLGEEFIELYILARTPDSFNLMGERVAIQQGATLYRFRYPSSGSEPTNP